MKDNSYLILAVNAREANRLQNELWVPSRNIVNVSTLHRSLAGVAGGDVYYTDDALAALVEDAELRDSGHTVSGTGSPAIMEEGKNWRRWREVRPRLRSVHPLEAWVHLHETSIEELEVRRMGFVTMGAQAVLPADQLEATDNPLALINLHRAQCAAAVRAGAANRLVRIAATRVVVSEDQAPDGSVTIRAEWSAKWAADRAVPSWLVSGLEYAAPELV